MKTVHELADYHKAQCVIALATARGCEAWRGPARRAMRAYWQNMAAFHREEYARLSRQARQLDEYKAAYARAARSTER